MSTPIDRLHTGPRMSKIVRHAGVHLRDTADFAAMNAVWEAWLPTGAAPACTTVQALLASADLRVEITVAAASC